MKIESVIIGTLCVCVFMLYVEPQEVSLKFKQTKKYLGQRQWKVQTATTDRLLMSVIYIYGNYQGCVGRQTHLKRGYTASLWRKSVEK